MITKLLEIEDYLEKKLLELEKSGSDKVELLKLKKEAYNTLKNEAIDTEELIYATNKFLNEKNKTGNNMIRGISMSIGVSDNIGISIIGGKNNNNDDINEDTMFDIASVTKFYTLLLVFKLVELNYFSLNDKIEKLDPRFKLDDFTVLDLLLMYGEINTKGHIKNAQTREEAEKLLQTAFIKSSDRNKTTYTDMGAIILSKVIETVFNKKNNADIAYDKIMSKFIFEKYNMKNTTFKPETLNVAGNGNDKGHVHDPKARILGTIGSAGIFTNLDDVAILAKAIFNNEIISKENLSKCGEKAFEDSNKGYMGLYQKHSANLERSYTPGLFANGSFSHQGWTGSVVVFDPINKIHNSILVNAIPLENIETQNDKVIGYKDKFVEYQQVVIKVSIIMKILNDYKKYRQEEFNFKKQIKL